MIHVVFEVHLRDCCKDLASVCSQTFHSHKVAIFQISAGLLVSVTLECVFSDCKVQ